MYFKKHFLPEDKSKAVKEYNCIMDLLTLVTLNLRAGNIDTATDRAEEMLFSLQELNHLSARKYKEERKVAANE